MRSDNNYTKLFFLPFIFSLFFLASCINNSDEYEPPTTGEVDLPLTLENLLGKWEVYYRTKHISSSALNVSTEYRYFDYDGFSSTFEFNGKDSIYYEHNVFDMQVIKGKFNLLKSKDSDKYDRVKIVYNSKKTGIDTTVIAQITNISANRMISLDAYSGDAQGYRFEVRDMSYYRNVERNPNYTFDGFYKNIIDESKLLGYWKLISTQNYVNGNALPETEEIRDSYGLITEFRIENNKRVFREYKANKKTPNRVGEYKVVDDVVHMFHYVIGEDGNIELDENGEKKTDSFAYYITSWTDGKTEMFTEEYKSRDEEDNLKEIASISNHVKVDTFPY